MENLHIVLTIAAVVFFGQAALIMITACIATAIVTEMVMNKLKGESFTVGDGSGSLVSTISDSVTVEKPSVETKGISFSEAAYPTLLIIIVIILIKS